MKVGKQVKQKILSRFLLGDSLLTLKFSLMALNDCKPFEPTISIRNMNFISGLDTFSFFPYVGSVVASDTKREKVIMNTITIEISAFEKLQKRLWSFDNGFVCAKILVPGSMKKYRNWCNKKKKKQHINSSFNLLLICVLPNPQTLFH